MTIDFFEKGAWTGSRDHWNILAVKCS